MKRCFTAGDFDVFNKEDLHLINKMKKEVAISGGSVSVFLRSGFAIFKSSGSFPIQDFDLRLENLKYSIEDVELMSFDPEVQYTGFVNTARGNGDKPIFFAYRDKPIEGIEVLKKLQVPIRYIKKPKE